MSNFYSGNFFKVYYSEHSSQKMRLPPTTVLFPNGVVTATATLRNLNSQCWHLEVYRDAGGTFFEKGWRKFIDDNTIEDENILVFNYVGSAVFDVTVFKLDGCVKIAPPLVPEEQEMDYSLVDDDDEEGEEEYDDDDNSYSQKEKETEEALDASNKRKCQKKINKINHGCTALMNDDGSTSMKDDKEYIERFIHHLDPLNPIFVEKKRNRRYNELVCSSILVLHFAQGAEFSSTLTAAQHVPSKFIRDYDLTLEAEEKITFIDPHNRKKTGNVVKWKDGRTCIRGWKSICKINKVNMQRDVCICEFLLQREQEEYGGQRTKHIKVHILRGNRTPQP